MSTMEQPEPPSEVLIPSLPNDIALNILARLPRQYHAVLSAVSKPFRSAVSSPQFFAIQSLLDRAENIVYLNVGSYDLSHDHWFAVHRNLSPVSNNKLLQLAPVPRIPIDAQLNGSAYVAVGLKIYVLGGFTNERGGMIIHSSNVWVLDCRSHVWEHGPSMPARCFDSEAAFLDGKRYVVGGVPSNKKSWVEVLDLAVGHWEAIPCPLDGISMLVYGIELLDDKISIGLGRHDLRLDPMTEMGGIEDKEPLLLDNCHCVVDEVLYHSSGWRFRRFDKKIGFWKYLKGVAEGKPNYAYGPRLLNLEGRLFIAFAEVRFGDTVDSKEGKFRVWCAEIDVTEDGDGDWWGRVRWSDKVPLLPERNWGSPVGHFNDKVCPCFCKCLSVSL